MFGPFGPAKIEETPQQKMLRRISEGVPADLAVRAAGFLWEAVKDLPGMDAALAEGEIKLFEQARDSGVTGTIRAAMRRETKSWQPKAESDDGKSLEDYLRD
jgi:hypothetical protein